MQRLLTLGFIIIALLSGCGTTAMDSESTREVVLQYLGADAAVGTAGPFGKGGKKELDVLSPADRQKGDALIDQGAVFFLVYSGTAPTSATGTAPVTRAIFVQKGQVVADLRTQPKS